MLWAIEGVGRYGALVAGAVSNSGFRVVEAPRRYAPTRRSSGKTDPIDAAEIAAATLPLLENELRIPRQADGIRAVFRVLTAVREQMTLRRTSKINALTTRLRIVALGVDACKSLTEAQVDRVSSWGDRNVKIDRVIARAEAVRLAKRMQVLNGEIKDSQERVTELFEAGLAAPLLDVDGVGPPIAALVYTLWSHPGRARSEAAFVALSGVNPITALSGNVERRWLSRGGDRRLNSALHMATIVRTIHDPETCAYAERRKFEGRSSREVRQILKGYIARRLYRLLNAVHSDSHALVKKRYRKILSPPSKCPCWAYKRCPGSAIAG